MIIRERIKRKIEKYKRIRHKGGHGIHSPFAFRLVTEVVEEQHGYYRLREFRKVFRQMKGHRLLENSQLRPQRYYALLFRLLNRFPVDQVIQAGTHFGLLQLLVRMVERETPYYWIERDPRKVKLAEEFINEVSKQIKPTLAPLRKHRPSELKEIDFSQKHFFFLHSSGIEELSLSDLNKALRQTHSESVWVVDAITFNSHMKQLWNVLKEHPCVIASFDLIDVGVLVFNPKIHPQDYKLFF